MLLKFDWLTIIQISREKNYLKIKNNDDKHTEMHLDKSREEIRLTFIVSILINFLKF